MKLMLSTLFIVMYRSVCSTAYLLTVLLFIATLQFVWQSSFSFEIGLCGNKMNMRYCVGVEAFFPNLSPRQRVCICVCVFVFMPKNTCMLCFSVNTYMYFVCPSTYVCVHVCLPHSVFVCEHRNWTHLCVHVSCTCVCVCVCAWKSGTTINALLSQCLRWWSTQSRRRKSG